MKIRLPIIIISLSFYLLFAQGNHAPEVTNVTFNQRTDGSFLVDIYYDVNDGDGDTMSVTIQVSDDAGVTWGFFCTNISGDVNGAEVLSGSGKYIEWDFGTEHPQTFSDQIQIKIIADDNYEGFETGTVTDIDGNVYKTVKIGDQWWMAENLKVKHYRNGDSIPNVIENSQWAGLSTGAYCGYNNEDNNIAIYGLLYNWYAVNDSRNIAPAGWHVPKYGYPPESDEYETLVMYLYDNGYECDGPISEMNTGKSLASKTGWSPSSVTCAVGNNMATNNTSGFSALPGGYRDYDGLFYGVDSYAFYWYSTEYGYDAAWYRYLYFDNSDFSQYYFHRLHGFSVRCIRD